ncbi:MAG: hypothetical protein E7571_03935, partial [Ruminococcaceae bacterium]|nr:hypothetical protein [Oscillospiraceae bacterium]
MSDYLEPPKKYRSTGGEKEQKVVKHTGKKLNKLDIFTLGGMDIPFFAITIALLTVGLVMLFSASYPYALQNEGNSYYYFSRQLIFAIAGVVVMLAVSKMNYRLLKVIVKPLLAFTILLL